MTDKPLLFYVGCRRGAARGDLRAEATLDGHCIQRGPLRGCWSLRRGPVVRFGRGYALVFKLAIRL